LACGASGRRAAVGGVNGNQDQRFARGA
jgi:hypothetical protein